MTAAELPGYTRETFAHGDFTHDVYRAGTGPAVIVMHEIPGLHPGVVELAQHLLDAKYTVYLPSLFGRVGAPFSGTEVLRTVPRVCVSREFALLADRTSPVNTWLCALAAKAHRECGGPGVGAIGMCFTGGFALAMGVDASVLASVMSQPSLPGPIGDRRRAALGLDREDRERIVERARSGALRVVGLRFTGDRTCPGERFATLRRELGASFEGIEIDSSPGNPHGISSHAHSVLTMDLVDEPGHRTRAARDRVLAFLAERLRPAS